MSGGYLSISEVVQKFVAPTALLAGAAATGASMILAGDGLAGLADSILALGGPAVVGSVVETMVLGNGHPALGKKKDEDAMIGAVETIVVAGAAGTGVLALAGVTEFGLSSEFISSFLLIGGSVLVSQYIVAEFNKK